VPLAFFIVNLFCMALLYGRASRLTAKNGGLRPGQARTSSRSSPAARRGRRQVLVFIAVLPQERSHLLGRPWQSCSFQVQMIADDKSVTKRCWSVWDYPVGGNEVQPPGA
jgi:hypothetical protein